MLYLNKRIWDILTQYDAKCLCHHWFRRWLVACLIPIYRQLNTWKYSDRYVLGIQTFSFRKMHLKMLSACAIIFFQPRSVTYTQVWVGLWCIRVYKYNTVNLAASWNMFPDSKVHGANMGPTWVLAAPGGPHFGPMILAIRELLGIWHGLSFTNTSKPSPLTRAVCDDTDALLSNQLVGSWFL